jgi:hypothetical protein
MQKNPCYGCSERHSSCHSKCPAYREWKAEHEALKERERKYKDETCRKPVRKVRRFKDPER